MFSVKLVQRPCCFVTLPPSARSLAEDRRQATFRCLLSDGRSVFVTCTGWNSSEGTMIVPAELARCLGISDGEECSLSSLEGVRVCLTLSVRTNSLADYRLLNSASEFVSSSLLDKAACVWSTCRLPVWLDSHNVVTVSVESLTPNADCLMLINNTKLEVLPPLECERSAYFCKGQLSVSHCSSAIVRRKLRASPLPQLVWLPGINTSVQSLVSQRCCIVTADTMSTILDLNSSRYCWLGSETNRCLVYLLSEDDLEVSTKDLPSCPNSSILIPDVVRRKLEIHVSDFVWISTIARSEELPKLSHIDCVCPLQRLSSSQLDSVKHTLAGWCRVIRSWSLNSESLLFSQGCLIRVTDESTLYEFDLMLETDHQIFALSDVQNIALRARASSRMRPEGVIRWPLPISNFNMKSDLPDRLSWYCLFPKSIVDELEALIQCSLRFNNGTHVFLVGESGSGKSSLLREVCGNLSFKPPNVYVEYIDCRSMVGKRYDVVADVLNSAFNIAAVRMPSLIVLDDFDCLVPDIPLSQRAIFACTITSMLQDRLQWFLLHGFTVVVVFVSSSPPRQWLVPFICSQFDIPLFNEEQRVNVFAQLSGLSHCDCIKAARLAEGYNLRQLVQAVVHAKFGTKSMTSTCLSSAVGSVTSVCRKKPSIIDNGHYNLNNFSPNFNTIGALSELKQSLIRLVCRPLQYPNLYLRARKHHQTRLMLYGPPGCGKTSIVHNFANDVGRRISFYFIKGPELLSKYVGSSEAAVRQLFERAHRSAPSIIFFDEFDSMAPRRSHGSTGVTDRCVNQLLSLLDGAENDFGSVAVLAASCRPDLIDPALLRPGRFGRLLYCPEPTSALDRTSVLEALTGSLPWKLGDDVDLNRLALDSMTRRLTGADLRVVVCDAYILALREQQLLDTNGECQTCFLVEQLGDNKFLHHHMELIHQQMSYWRSKNSAPISCLLCQRHLEAASRELRPSISDEQWQFYDSLSAKIVSGSEANRSRPDQQRQRVALL